MVAPLHKKQTKAYLCSETNKKPLIYSIDKNFTEINGQFNIYYILLHFSGILVCSFLKWCTILLFAGCFGRKAM